MRAVGDFLALKAQGRVLRGAHCLVVALARPGSPRKVAFVASRRGVGGAVQRNRARRRLREIVRRRWSRMAAQGVWMMFVAFRSALTASHEELVRDVEALLARASAAPPRTAEG